MTSSGNGLETVVFNQLDGDGGWERWELQDNGRAEVPLIDGEETHVAGMAVSLCSTCNIQISECDYYHIMIIYMYVCVCVGDTLIICVCVYVCVCV